MLVLAVKPQVLAGVLDALTIRKEQVIISICAGISFVSEGATQIPARNPALRIVSAASSRPPGQRWFGVSQSPRWGV